MALRFANIFFLVLLLLAVATPALAKQREMIAPECQAFVPTIARPLMQQEVRAAVIDAADYDDKGCPDDESGRGISRRALAQLRQ